MAMFNGSLVTEFWLMGLSENQNIQKWLAGLLLFIYFLTVTGNLSLITAWALEPRLQTPMYLFLANLALQDICFSSVILPNMVFYFLVRRPISFASCTAQMFMYLFFGNSGCILLAVMAYDRYVAIVHPLRYAVIMSKPVCITLVAACWLIGGYSALMETLFTMMLPFCGPNIINHFFCETSALLRLACADTFAAELEMTIDSVIWMVFPIIFILISYVRIIATIIRIRSSEARLKAFSTCSSHLIVVSTMYGPAMFMYMKPASTNTANSDKIISIFYTVIPPMMNPFIYSLRNKDVKTALNKISLKHIFDK